MKRPRARSELPQNQSLRRSSTPSCRRTGRHSAFAGCPFRDTLTGPNGGALAIQYEFRQDEEGNLVTRGGLVEVAQRTLSKEELEEFGAGRAGPASVPAPVVPPDVAALAADSGAHRFTVSLSRVGVEHVGDLVDRDIMMGLVRSAADLSAARSRALEVRRAVQRQRQDPVVLDVEALGGKVVHRCQTLFCLTVEMTGTQIADLARRNQSIVSVGRVASATIETGDAGSAVASGSQITPALLAGYDGIGAYMRVPMAQIEAEHGGPNPNHPGFKDSASGGSRISTLLACQIAGCTTPPNWFTYQSDHGTAVAGLMIGTLDEGQDPTITEFNDRWDKGGYAREAFLAYVLSVDYNVPLSVPFDYLASRSIPPLIVNFSGGHLTEDPSCTGSTPISRAANDLFENGELLVKSAGNVVGSSIDCTVSSPGSAIGVFTVGGHGTDPMTDPITPDEVRTEGIYIDPVPPKGSAYGGGATEGGNRTIVDLTAYAARKELFGSTSAFGYGHSDVGTSLASATVAAAAADFADYYNTNFGFGFDYPSPGMLFVNMLLMGDRKGGSSTLLTTGFDPLWGAGRLRLRTFDAAGLDAPGDYLTGSVCVGNSQTIQVALNQGVAIPAGVDVLKAAIYWYDARHEMGQSYANIDLRLRNTATGASISTSASAFDEKERIFYTSPSGKKLALEIVGTAVPGGSSGCAAGKMRVYYAMFYEDSARDDAEGPVASDVFPE